MKAWHICIGALALVAAPVMAAKAIHPIDFTQVLLNGARPTTDLQRDEDRKPADMLAFAEVRPGIKVAEIAPGGGYFSRLLSLAVGNSGKVYAISSRPIAWLADWNKAHPNVIQQSTPPTEALAPEPVDLVWTTQNYHDFKPRTLGGPDVAAQYNAAAFAILKPGGVYLVSDHEAAPGAGISVTSTLHRIESAAVIREVEAAGFKLEARSDVLKHPADDHTTRVFETGVRGKTDQFVLKFRKPKAKK